MSMRFDSAMWDGVIVSVLMTVIGFGILVMEAVDLPAAHRRDDRLQRDGVTVQVTVVEVLERGRTDVPLTVRVRLPDSRETTVELGDSEEDASREPGTMFDLRVVRDDAAVNRPADELPETSRQELVFLLIPAGFGFGGIALGVALLRHRARRSGDA